MAGRFSHFLLSPFNEVGKCPMMARRGNLMSYKATDGGQLDIKLDPESTSAKIGGPECSGSQLSGFYCSALYP
jgi:hypothetical protein